MLQTDLLNIYKEPNGASVGSFEQLSCLFHLVPISALLLQHTCFLICDTLFPFSSEGQHVPGTSPGPYSQRFLQQAVARS